LEAVPLLWFQGELGKFGNLFSNIGLVPWIVLFILLFFSIFSWAIIFKKHSAFKRAHRQSQEFLSVFQRSKKLSEIRASAEALDLSPLSGVFMAGYREIEGQAVYSENPGKPRIRSVESVRRALQIASSDELSRLEHWLHWLATTGGVCPFIGLFGTVWGIIDAFNGLGMASTASLQSVAPGIAEALITTAGGLFAAIPAVIAYNHYLQRVKSFGNMLDEFSLQFLNLTERHFM
jgi:biopolymer transport protein TolQ